MQISSAPTHGAIVPNPNRYIPFQDYFGMDEFRYQVTNNDTGAGFV